jgi:hypothetical protein
MKTKRSPFLLCLIVCALWLVEAPVCRADRFHVTVDTSVLIGHSAGPFFIDFQLNDGRGVGDENHTATIDNFSFAGGSTADTPLPAIGGVSGSLSTSLKITDSEFLNQFTQQFTPGGMLSFDVDLTTGLNTTSAAVGFSFAILDRTLAPLPTVGLADALVFVNVDAENPIVEAFPGDPTRGPAGGGPPISLTAPEIRVTESLKPSCAITKIGKDASGKKFIELTVQATQSGLASIKVLVAVNSTVSIPSFHLGTFGPVMVTVTEQNQSLPSQVELEIRDVAGNLTRARGAPTR